MKNLTPPIEWVENHIRIIDQTLLPAEVKIVEVRTAAAAVDAIDRLAIRGAPALGAFGALALVVGLDEQASSTFGAATRRLEELRTFIGDARPTAVNLRWAVDRVIDHAVSSTETLDDLRSALLAEAHKVAAEDAAACEEIGRLGHELLRTAVTIGTHCNAGRLATAGNGTALAPIYAKAEAGEPLRVLASETRPLLQGARLTAWELDDAGIDVTVLPDAAMASTVLSGKVDAYIVGADRIAANGDTANKIGTVAHALAAREAGIPFYVAAPTSTIDAALPSGNHIEIEERDASEVHEIQGKRVTPEGVAVANPAFDVTPENLITAIITEVGVLRAPFQASIADALLRAGASQ
jgi:methylthioribose-1-phosphate isomerase